MNIAEILLEVALSTMNQLKSI